MAVLDVVGLTPGLTLAHQRDQLAWGSTAGNSHLALGLEKENVLKVKMRKGDYVDWKCLKNPG